jgi:hypothetical protein
MRKRTYVIVLIVAAIVIAMAIATHREGGLFVDWAARMHGR